jgi:hypothetical protein
MEESGFDVFESLFQKFPGGTKESREILNYDSRSPGGVLNPGPPEYEA